MTTATAPIPKENQFLKLLFEDPTASEISPKKVISDLRKIYNAERKIHPMVIDPESTIATVMEFVIEWHRGESRKNSTQTIYAQHPVLMAAIANKADFDDEIIIACLLKAIAQKKQSIMMTYHDYRHIQQQCKFNEKLLNILNQLASIPKNVKAEELSKKERVETREIREKAKLDYLDSINNDALLVEFISRLEHLIADLKDIKISRKNHWKFFTGSAKDEINFFRKCGKVFEKRLSERNYPGVSRLLQSFRCHVNKLERIYLHS